MSACLNEEYSDFTKNCIAYISGNVVSVVCTKTTCDICAEALLDTEEAQLDDQVKLLIVRKDRGGLFTPCQTVYKILERTDKIFRRVVAGSRGSLNISMLDKKFVT